MLFYSALCSSTELRNSVDQPIERRHGHFSKSTIPTIKDVMMGFGWINSKERSRGNNAFEVVKKEFRTLSLLYIRSLSIYK